MGTVYLDRHEGYMNPDGTVIVYNILFPHVTRAIQFLRPYPVGPDYHGVLIQGLLILVEGDSQLDLPTPVNHPPATTRDTRDTPGGTQEE